ncbi:hypothetical protein, partial [Achromobacter spanius]|uniref:hypothetical protein n=1 Tax=Achromobacter spanius TaxID=217203 RepID=UPI003F68DD52
MLAQAAKLAIARVARAARAGLKYLDMCLLLKGAGRALQAGTGPQNHLWGNSSESAIIAELYQV